MLYVRLVADISFTVATVPATSNLSKYNDNTESILRESIFMHNLTPEKDRILQCIFDTIDEMNETLPDNRKLEKSTDIRLIGKAGGLDSLEFVNFIVLLEQRVAEEFGAAVTLADERALSREKSPFSTIGRLTDYLTELLESQGSD